MVLRWGVFVVLLLAFILVPFMLLEGRMNELVQQTLQSKASLAWITLAVIVFLLADIVLPVPSSFVLSTTGYLLGTGVGTAVAFIGLTCASRAGYALGRYAGGPLTQRVVGRAQLERFAELSRHHGDLLLVAFRAMPVMAEATTILATVDGQPRARPITATWTDGLTVYFANLKRFHNATQEEAFQRDALLRHYLRSADNPEFTLYRVRPTRVRFMREWALDYFEVPL